MVWGFPAHAGIDPLEPVRSAWTSRFPRPRGDRPMMDGSLLADVQVSPPTRG